MSSGIEVVILKNAFKNRIQSYKYINREYIDLILFFNECQDVFAKQAKRILNNMFNLKSNLILEAKFIRSRAAEENDAEINQISTFYLQCGIKKMTLTTNLNKWFKDNVVDVIMKKVDELQENGSGWRLHEIISLDVNFNLFDSVEVLTWSSQNQ